ncbi:Metal-dependent hydrolase, endonuclease/exonuclease/phosphatase family [Streptomyces aidingensis]|uniref:Metal-dependent hydrolase, endonuclease/exonuclease/phosphatase family n=2 Tax=Streptomyces aidingensis TaxID=910347 RepID=A0A1I1JK34_9ACTN|nr:Metal-dependent hydrolase, endonuclease/exonuclease/phosphatase family [Streptomyces aidingensis]
MSGAGPSAAAAEPVAVTGMIGTYNIYGNVGHRGDAGTWIEEEAERLHAIAPPGGWFSLALQEVCHNQGAALAAATGMHGTFYDTGVTCANGERYGNVILTRSAPLRTHTYTFPTQTGREEKRGAVCAVFPAILGEVVTCSVHLESGSEEVRAAQAAELMAWQPGGRPFEDYAAALIGGDLNAEPHHATVTPLYQAAEEADGPRDAWRHATHDDGRKLDYLFTTGTSSNTHWRTTATTAVATPHSDHLIYASRLDCTLCLV